MHRICRVLLAFLLCAANAAAQTKPSAEQRTAKYMRSIRHQPSLLLPFLREMPKGGVSHNHLDGAVYAESLIDFAAEDGLCVDRTTSILIAPPAILRAKNTPANPQPAALMATMSSTTP